MKEDDEEDEDEEAEDDDDLRAMSESGDEDVKAPGSTRDLGAAASLTRLEAVLSTGWCSQFVLEGYVSKLMRKYYRPCNADNTQKSPLYDSGGNDTHKNTLVPSTLGLILLIIPQTSE